ncbi:hypothetical protein LINPERHAP1_LOCUS31382, partial [Linum perenne]
GLTVVAENARFWLSFGGHTDIMRWFLTLSVDIYRNFTSLNLYCRVILDCEVVMVCQAAGQTNFRALKYENGIAGSAAIVVRVIACFHTLEECQAEYFRQLLKPVT